MPTELKTTGALDDHMPSFRAGANEVQPIDPGALLAVLPLPGAGLEASALVRQLFGVGLPPVGTIEQGDGAEVIWSERDTWLVASGIGALVTAQAALDRVALTCVRTGAWAVLRVTGPGSADILSRLTPLDVRVGSFGPGRSARTEIAHMAGMILGRNDGYDIWVPRSFAGTIAREVKEAAENVAARN